MTEEIDSRPKIDGYSPSADSAEELGMFLTWIGDLVATAGIMQGEGDATRTREECAPQIEAILVATSELVRTARAYAVAMAKREIKEEANDGAVKEQAVSQNAG